VKHSTIAFVLLLAVNLLAQVNPIPTISGPVSPQTVTPGSNSFTLTVQGAGFVSGAVVNWNGAARSTTFMSASKLQAQILASDIALPGSAMVTVTNPLPGGGLSSSSFATLEIHQPISGITLAPPHRYGNDGAAGSLVFTADLNGDNRLDLVQTGNGIEVLLGNANGTFSKSTSLPQGALSISFGDFNNDGKEDLVFVSAQHAHVCLGDGTGKFHELPGSFGTFTFPQWTAVGDFNRDGKLDLEVSEESGNFYILLGNGDGTFQTQQVSTSLAFPDYPKVVDANGDGILDLIFYDPSLQAVAVLLGNGDGTFQPPITTAIGAVVTAPVLNDFNQDGRIDVAFALNQQIGVLIGNGDGTFQPPQFFSTGLTSQLLFTAGDFNSDGLTDLLAYKVSPGAAALLSGNGDGTFQLPVRISLPGPQTGHDSPFVGDFNSDGLLDLGISVGGAAIFLQEPQ